LLWKHRLSTNVNKNDEKKPEMDVEKIATIEPNVKHDENKLITETEIESEKAEKIKENIDKKTVEPTGFQFIPQEKNSDNVQPITGFQFATQYNEEKKGDDNDQSTTGFQFQKGITQVNNKIFDEYLEGPTGDSFYSQTVTNTIVVESTGFCFGLTQVNNKIFDVKKPVNPTFQFGSTTTNTQGSDEKISTNTFGSSEASTKI